MSNWIFDPTSLPGFKRLHRQPLQRTILQDIDSGKEARISKYLTQRWRYEPEIELLRSSATFLELQKILGFFTRHAGKKENFLLLDPEDNAVTDHGFGVGDGTTTTFQLQRTLLAGTLTQDALGSWDTYTKPRTNLVLQSQTFDNASWTKTSTTVTANQAVAPDGTLTADKIVESAAVSVEHYVEQAVSFFTDGTTATTYVHARAAERSWIYVATVLRDATTVRGAWFNLATGAIGTVQAGVTASIVALTGGYYRCIATGAVGSGGSAPKARLKMGTADNQATYTGDGTSGIYLWGAQMEAGSTATQYIATTTAAVRDDPLYWPAQGDGFEPVLDPNFASVQVFKNGVVQSGGAIGGSPTWIPGAGGTIVWQGTPPAAGDVLSWTGSFWRRVRIDDDEPRFEQIMPGRFRGPFEMVSVI